MGSCLIFQGPEDEAILTEIIREAVIKSVEKLFFNPGNGTLQRSLHLKNIAINWLFLFDKTMASLRYAYKVYRINCFSCLIVLLDTPNDLCRRYKDEEKTSRYMNMFSYSLIPHHLINWVISQGEVIRDADALRNLTPASFIGKLLPLSLIDSSC